MPAPFIESGNASRSDRAQCRALIRRGSRSFYAAAVLLPPRIRIPAFALYGFCREADDAVDETAAATTLEQLQERLHRIYCGCPRPGAVDRAFADAVAQHSIPRALPDALLEGFAWDLAGRRYGDLDALTDYAARVAGTVGAMMACIMGVRDPAAVARASELGIAMQLTNIARDVGTDARAGRLYIPLQWLREAGIDPEVWLARPAFNRAVGSVVGRLLEAADGLYERATAGIRLLPRDCRCGIRAARLIYAEIGASLRRQGLDSVSRRAVVPLRRKLALIARSLSAEVDGGWEQLQPHASARFLVAAVLGQPASHAVPRVSAWDARMQWLHGLYERLEQRDRGFLRQPRAGA